MNILILLDISLALILLTWWGRFYKESKDEYYGDGFISATSWLVITTLIFVVGRNYEMVILSLTSLVISTFMLVQVTIMTFFIIKDGVDAHFTPLHERPSYIAQQEEEKKDREWRIKEKRIADEKARTKIKKIFNSIRQFLADNKYELLSDIKVSHDRAMLNGEIITRRLRETATDELGVEDFPLTVTCRVKIEEAGGIEYGESRLLVESNLDVHFVGTITYKN